MNTTVVALGAFLIGWQFTWWRPWWHWLAMWGYRNPSIVLGVGLSILPIVATVVVHQLRLRAYRTAHDNWKQLPWPDQRNKMEPRRPLQPARWFVLGPVLSALVLVSGIVFSHAFSSVALSGQVLDATQELDGLPELSVENARILPFGVAYVYVENSLQYPRHSAANPDIAVVDGKPYWSLALEPNGVINTFAGRQLGAVLVDMTTEEKKVQIIEDEFRVGIGMGLTDSVTWSLQKQRYWVDYEKPSVIVHEGELWIVSSMTEYDTRWRMGIPFTVPKWGGVAIVGTDGDVEFLTPPQAAQDERLEGQRLFPFDLAKRQVESVAYQHGIKNAWFFHKDQLEVAPVAGDGFIGELDIVSNDQPFVVVSNGGDLLYITAVEPWGDAYGVYQVWVHNARTGQVGRWTLDPQSSLFGANKAMEFVRKDNALVDWTHMKEVESLPVVVADELYWHIKVVPVDNAGIAFTAFVNAHTGNVTMANSDAEVHAFLRGEQGQGNTTSQPSTGPVPSVQACVYVNGNETCVPSNATGPMAHVFVMQGALVVRDFYLYEGQELLVREVEEAW